MKQLYVAQRLDATGYVKIGTTSNLAQRMVGLRASIKGPLRLLKVIDGIENGAEPLVQNELAEHRAGVGREWFLPTATVMAFVLSDSLYQFIESTGTCPYLGRPELGREVEAIRDLGKLPATAVINGVFARGLNTIELAASIGLRPSDLSRELRGSHRCHRVITERIHDEFRARRLLWQAEKKSR